MVAQMMEGRVPAIHARAIQYFSQGAVMPWDCRPTDWWVFWPELMADPLAPDVPKPLRLHWPDFTSPLGQHLFKPALSEAAA
jgi:hypothetical protein